MKVDVAKNTIRQKYLLLETHCLQLMETVAGLTEVEFNKPHNPGKWSTGQILVHINHVFERSMGYINKKMQEPDKIPDAGLITGAKSTLLNLVLKSKLKFKAPKGVDVVPEHVDFETVRLRIVQNLNAVKDLTEQFPEKYYHKAIFKHPAVGRITLQQTVTFLDAHFLHHEQQIRLFLHNRQ